MLLLFVGRFDTHLYTRADRISAADKELAALDKNPIKPREPYRQTPNRGGHPANIARGLCRLPYSR